MDNIRLRTQNLLFKISINIDNQNFHKDSYHLDFENNCYREDDLIKLIKDTVIYFALTPQELAKINSETIIMLQNRAWNRISNRHHLMKGDYGELLLFLILEVFYPARKLITKVRLRSSYGDEVKGFDCAHFSLDNNDISLWLGEAKFHQSFSTAISQATKSINEHLNSNIINDELSIIESNNTELDDVDRDFIENYLNSGISLDKMNFKIPVLLTYDSSVIKSHNSITQEFINDLSKELTKKYQNIENKNLNPKNNIELIFILLPLKTVKYIKEQLFNIELAHK